MPGQDRPQVVVTVTFPPRHNDADRAARKNRLYADAIERHGGNAVVLDGSAGPGKRAAAFEAMDGLLLSGGADIDPARYGAANLGSVEIEPERDELEFAAWRVAETRNVPVLGICRGFQAINVFAGGMLTQDVAGHAGPSWGDGPAATHPLRIAGGSYLASLIAPAGAAELRVNTYHHQAVRPADLAPGLIATAWAPSESGDLVEAFERPGSRFVVGLQCHPERTESTPPAFDRVWLAFIEACRARRMAGHGAEPAAAAASPD
jgi:putative glutamine amidotransferase